MSLDATVGGSSADSYGTIVEADDYLAERYSVTDLAGWEALEEAAKELRMKLGAYIINTMSLRGAKACRNQSLEFPRWWRTDDGYPSYEDDYLDYTDIPIAQAPTISTDIKYAQFELAYQVVHNGILSSEILSFPEREIKSFGLGGSLSIEFVGSLLNKTQFSKARITSLDIVDLFLNKWIRKVGGGVI